MLTQIDRKILEDYVQRGLLRKQSHSVEDLLIYNYSAETQFSRQWDETTLACRGLIVDSVGTIVSRPLGKFFNLEEWLRISSQGLPKENYVIQEKLDGSLGISYWINGELYLASRGSFTSVQAIRANQLLQEDLYQPFKDKVSPDYTYCFEILYPENRIVVDYGTDSRLVLLSIINTQTGEEIHPDSLPQHWPYTPRIYSHNIPLKELSEKILDWEEGFVIRWDSGFRVKIKGETYCRLHKLLTGVSNQTIWEFLSEGKPLTEILEAVPDEFYDWVKKESDQLTTSFYEIHNLCLLDYNVGFKQGFQNRKEWAEYIKTKKYPSILFLILDLKDTRKAIWDKIRPAFQKPFNQVAIDE